MPSLSLPRPSGGGRTRRRRPGIGGTLLVFLVLTVGVFVLAGFVISDFREPEITNAKADQISPELDRIQPGASERQVRDAFGEPARVETNSPGSDRCLFYSNLPSNQPAYRFCFEGGKLETISAQ